MATMIVQAHIENSDKENIRVFLFFTPKYYYQQFKTKTA